MLLIYTSSLSDNSIEGVEQTLSKKIQNFERIKIRSIISVIDLLV
jgi:hypothetical protein